MLLPTFLSGLDLNGYERRFAFIRYGGSVSRQADRAAEEGRIEAHSRDG